MSGGMSEWPQWTPDPGPVAPEPAPPPPLQRALLGWTVLLAVAAGAGWIGGQLWWRWWGPGPDGVVYETQQGDLVWLPDPPELGFAELFSATGQYVVIGLGLGLLLGLLAGLVCRGRELPGLVVALGAAGLAAWLSYTVGTDLSPSDPQAMAADAGAGAELPGALAITGWTPYLGWPAGVLIGFIASVVLAPSRSVR